MEQIGSGLEYLHRNAVVHGGLSGVSVLVDSEGWARITDPGIMASLYRAAVPRSEWEGLLDPAYAAPEVLERRLVGPAADQYSLALLAYQCLTGRPAWTGEAIEDVRRERAAGLEPLDAARPGVPPFAATALARALREVPAERFGSVLDFVAVLSGAALRPAGGGLSPSASPGGPPLLVLPDNERPRPGGRRWVVYVGLALLAAGGTWGALWLQRRPADRWVFVPPPAAQAPGVPAGTPDSLPTAPAPAPTAGFPAPQPTPPRPAAARPSDMATLFVNASPWGVVYVDGRPVGNTPRPSLAVPAGVHVLRVVRDGYTPFEREIRLTPGQVLRITDIVLEPIRP
jgi:serine/threonine-protein kinase